MGSQFLHLLFRRMLGLPVSALVVQKDALLPVSVLVVQKIHYSQFLLLLFRAMHVRTSSFCSYCSELCMYVLPVSVLIVQNNALTLSLCSCCSELCMYVLPVSALIVQKGMLGLPVSALVVQSYVRTYFQFLPLFFSRMHGLPVSALVVQKDAWAPSFCFYCSALCMYVRTSSFSSCCSECMDSPVSAFIVGGRPRNYLFLSEKWNRETSALPTSI
jgi:hypothetical protein